MARVSWTGKGIAPHTATVVDGSFEIADYFIFLVIAQIYCITFSQDGFNKLGYEIQHLIHRSSLV
ncbi:MAG: hypothetical protein M3Y53_10115 [Thermoproteota archaeon]|nr:hypothetical protein [Thermoproteota archaeon]